MEKDLGRMDRDGVLLTHILLQCKHGAPSPRLTRFINGTSLKIYFDCKSFPSTREYWRDCVARWIIFLKVLKVKTVLYKNVPMIFTFFVPCSGEKKNGNSSFRSLVWNRLLILKILTETHFKMLFAAFRKPPEMMVKNSIIFEAGFTK